ncbi:MAG TPA: DUF2442 domain-containing protein [bacterium]|nr:DUF2442 domain-containing protein [bacterium]
MRSATNPEAHRATQIAPAIRPEAPWRVASVNALPGLRLQVTFVDGTVGEVDLKAFLSDHKVEGTLFEPLRNWEEFARVHVEMGAVRWPNGADLAPDAMYDAIRQRGCWVLG